MGIIVKINIFLIAILTISCQSVIHRITYKYNGIVINREDEDAETRFFYNGTKNCIYTDDSGIISGFSGFLLFKKGGKVELLSGDGYYQYRIKDTSKFIYRSIIKPEEPQLRDSVCFISSGLDMEKKFNKNSKVKITYN